MSKISQCPLCQNTQSKIKYLIDKFKIAQCKMCGMIYVKDNFGQDVIYDQSYFQNQYPRGGFANYFGWRDLAYQTFEQRFARIKKYQKKPGNILDVGCALGEFLTVVKKGGWQVFGIDISNYAVEYARSKRKLNATCSNLIKNNFPENFFDVISMQDLLEHLDNPLEYLAHAKKILKNNGILYLVTPDVGGFYAKLLGRRWYHYKPREHLVYFSKQTIKKALQQVGFEFITYQKTANVVNFEYLFNRLYYYQPKIITVLGKIFTILNINKVKFHLNTGEMEVFARK